MRFDRWRLMLSLLDGHAARPPEPAMPGRSSLVRAANTAPAQWAEIDAAMDAVDAPPGRRNGRNGLMSSELVAR
jgi:hypothetical protein